jgi:hypothetical protein
MALAINSFIFALVGGVSSGSKVSHSTTVYLDDQTDIFVAQVALTSLIQTIFCLVYISGITLSNGEHLEINTFPRAIEWADTESVTFVVEVQSGGDFNSSASASALATITSYSET